RIVFDVDTRQGPLGGAEQLCRVFPGGARLEDDAVELLSGQPVVRHDPYVVAPGQAGTQRAIAGRVARAGDDGEVVRQLAQVVQVVAVYVPGQYAQAGIRHGWPPGRVSAGHGG